MRFALSAAVLLLLLLLGPAAWLLYTPAGARWLLTEFPANADTGVSVAQLQGSLLGQLQLQSYRLEQGAQRLDIGRLEMHSRLASLLPLRLEIERLRLSDIRLQLPPTGSDPAPLRLVWPKLPAAAGWIECDIDTLQIEGLSWQQGDAPAQQLERFSTALHWRDAILSAEDFLLQLNENLDSRGQLTLGFSKPQLQLDVQLHNRAVDARWQTLGLQSVLQASNASLLQGQVSLQLQTGQTGRYQLSSRLRLSETRLDFDQLHLSRPERSGSVVAEGSYHFSTDRPQLSVQLNLDQLDLQQEAGQPLQLSGSLQVSGHPEQYSGRLSLVSSGSPQTQTELRGDFSGDLHKLQLSNLAGRWLEGELSGQLHADWRQGWQLQTTLQAERLNPERLHEALAGSLNLQLDGELRSDDSQAFAGELQLRLNDSQLHQQTLSGQLALQLVNQQLRVNQLQLLGAGISAEAEGLLDERLKLQLKIDHLHQLLPNLSGRFAGSGWLRWRAQNLDVQLDGQAQQLGYRQWSLDQLQLSLNGNLQQHQLSLQLIQPPGKAQLNLAGGWHNNRWQGKLTRLQGAGPEFGSWQLAEAVPLEASAEEVVIAPLQLRSSGQASLSGSGRYRLQAQQGAGELRWEKLPLKLLQRRLPVDSINGTSSGRLSLRLAEPEGSQLQATLELQGELQQQKLALKIEPSRFTADWDKEGLSSRLELQLADGGRLQAELSSPQPMLLGWPQQGQFHLAATEFPLERLHPWLPPTLKLGGQLALQASGDWSSDRRFTLLGQARADRGQVFWQEEEGAISAELNTARLDWQWQQDQLRGEFDLELSEQGEIDGRFRLPLASQLPVQPLPGVLQGELTAKLQELGLLSLLLPGAVQESRGQLNLDLALAGNWQQPQLTGKLHLFDAGAFLPTAGIQLKDVELLGEFDDRQIAIKQLLLSSGEGTLNGSGRLRLNRWQPDRYQLQLRGENFQLLHLPELQGQVSPNLQIDGNHEQIRVRGVLLVPELLISGKQKSTLPSNSPDLVILDAEQPQERKFRLRHDIDLQLELGERVLLKTAGIDAKLGGKLRLQSTAQQELAATGDIHVEKGRYASYGVNLDISRGHLYFAGGPLDQPTLDILALRKTGEVQAGVRVSGTPKQPQVNLYSQPSMPETDILAYIVLGRPLAADRSQTGLLLSAAGALLSQGESVVLQEKLKQSLGLDVLDISAGEGDVTSSVITTGKYLSPDLYISLGYSLFSNTNEVRLRYNLTPSWELESSIGVDSGVDIYYRIEIE